MRLFPDLFGIAGLIWTLRSGGADFIFIPERPPKADVWEDYMCDEIKKVITKFFALRVSHHSHICSTGRSGNARLSLS